jgi:hypothetical protein
MDRDIPWYPSRTQQGLKNQKLSSTCRTLSYAWLINYFNKISTRGPNALHEAKRSGTVWSCWLSDFAYRLKELVGGRCCADIIFFTSSFIWFLQVLQLWPTQHEKGTKFCKSLLGVLSCTNYSSSEIWAA